MGWVPAAAAAEIALLRERDRIGVGLPELRTAMEQTPNLRFLTLDLPQIEEFAALTSIQDPFDRLIIGACRAADAHLITRNGNLQGFKLVQTVWEYADAISMGSKLLSSIFRLLSSGF